MKNECLIYEELENNIAQIKFNRPESLNTLNTTLMNELEDKLDELSKNAQIRVIIFTGEGKNFCTGVDLKETWKKSTLLEAIKTIKQGPRLIRKLFELEQITISAINGGAFGGGACIATACDFRIGAEDCMSGFPESKLGMNLSWSALPMVVHLIGPTHAKEMVILGKNFNANTLHKWGFLSEIVPKEKLLERALEIANEYASMPPIAAQMIKRSINHIVAALDQSIMHMDRDQWLLTSKTQDFQEGVKAFFEKRKGKFIGD